MLSSHLATERDASRAQARSLRSQLAYDRGQSAYFETLASSLDARVSALQRSVAWDKAHLLDCWTVIVRKVPAGEMPHSARNARPAALLNRPLRREIGRCASDAVP